MSDGPQWFSAKRYGFGAGLPISWQGWAVLAVYIALMLGALLLLGERKPASMAVVIIATAVLLVVTARTTKGGWRWRWGDPD
jgi:hypothetical protein